MKSYGIWVAIGLIVLLLGILGYFITPREGGEALILSPSVRAVQGWRYEAERVKSSLRRIGILIERGLDENEALLSRSQSLEKALRECFELEKELGIIKAPLAYQKEKEQLLEAVRGFAEAVRLSIVYLNEPTEENKQSAVLALEKARALLEEVEDEN